MPFLARSAFLVACTLLTGSWGQCFTADGYSPPASDLSDEAGKTFLLAARSHLAAATDPKLQAGILFDISMVAAKLKQPDEENRAIVELLARFPESMEVQFLLGSLTYKKLSVCVVSSFEDNAKKNDWSNSSLIFTASRNLFHQANKQSSSEELLSILLLSNYFFQDTKIQLAAEHLSEIDGKLIGAIQKIKSPGRELLALDGSDFEKAVYGFIFNQKPAVDLRKSAAFALPRAVFLAENQLVKEAHEHLEACQDQDRSFAFLFARGWLRARMQKIKEAQECFQEIERGDYEPSKKDIARHSSRIIQNQLISKLRVLTEVASGFEKLGVESPKEFIGEVSYSANEKSHFKFYLLLNTEENRVEIAILKNKKIWWQFMSSRFETKIYAEKDGVIYKVDGQPFMPAIPAAPECKVDAKKPLDLKWAYANVDWNNANKTPTITSLKNLFQSKITQSPEVAATILKAIEGCGYCFDFQNKAPDVVSAALVKPDLAKGTLARYGMEKTKGKISAAEWGSVRLDRFDYSEVGFGDFVSKHLPDVKTVKAEKYEQIFQLFSLLQLFY